MNPDEVRADQQGSNEPCIKNAKPPGDQCQCPQCQAERTHKANAKIYELQEAMLLLEEWVTAPKDETYPERRRYTIDSFDGVRLFWVDRWVECTYHAGSYKGRGESIRQALNGYHAHRARHAGRLERLFEYIARVARGHYPSSIACKNDAIAVLRENEAPPAHLQVKTAVRTAKSNGPCAICGLDVFGYSWWTADPEKDTNAKPLHEGECWQKWNSQ